MILAVIAQESMGFSDPHRVLGIPYDRVESVGLMACAPFPWRGYTKEQLLNPYTNIKCGLEVLLKVYYSPTLGGQSLRRTLALYNCGSVYLEANRCGPRGGWHYADKVLNLWAPLFRQALLDGIHLELYYWSDPTQVMVSEFLFDTGFFPE